MKAAVQQALDQLGAIARERAQRSDFGIGAKRALEQAERVELLQPLGIIPITLALGNRLDMPRVDQVGRNAMLF